MPKPNKGEEHDEFISRCMGNEVMKDEFPDEKQRVAVCNEIWRSERNNVSPPEDMEKRSFLFTVETRSEKEPELFGHAAVFDTCADIFCWRERIERGAFSESIANDDVKALFNHDPNLLLGRTRNGTLKLEEDDIGLAVRIFPPDTSIGRDIITLVRRGDITQMSFAFTIAKGGEEWISGDGKSPDERIIKKVRLYDVSPVTYPAYDSTTISVRSYRVWKESLINSISRSESPRFVKRRLYEQRLKLRKRR